jgi:glycosyltransferase involved in cell wall biosynthesis
MRVAYFTPITPQKTGIADYSEKEVLPYLKSYIDIDLFIDKNIQPTNPSTRDNFNIYSYFEYKQRKNEYDAIIYNMGNNQYHKFIYDSILNEQGITILHDIYLHGFLWSWTKNRGDERRYIEEYKYCYGELGVEIAKKSINSGTYPEFEFPLIKRIIDNSLGVVCHSYYGIQKVLNEMDSAVISKINHPFTISNLTTNHQYSDIQTIKNGYGLIKNQPIITSFGFISSHKRYHIVLRAFKRFLQIYPDAVLLLVGQDLMGIDRLISSLYLRDSVIKTGYAAQKEIFNYLAISDFCINLRYPTAGETSGSVLQLMAAEKPVIVSNVGWFSEIPNNCCLKVDVDSYEEDILLQYMKLLASDEVIRKMIGKNAKEYVMKEHDPQKIAKELYIFIKNVLECKELIINKVSKELSDIGVTEDDYELIEFILRNNIL